MDSNRRNLIILFVTMVVIMLGFGIIIPILPFYIEMMGASGKDLGLLMAVFAFAQLIFAPFWGGLSDKVGRKPILLVGVLGNAITQLLMGLSTQLWMLFAARALAGILSSATLPTAMAYVSDSTSSENRGGGMGIIGAAMGVGMVVGPGLGGWLAVKNLSYPFFLASALSVLVMILLHIILPESLPPEKRTTGSRAFKGPDFMAMWQALRGPLGFLMFMSFLISFGLTNFEGVFGLYALERFGYGPEQVGSVLTIIGLTSAVVQGGLTGRLSKRFGDGRVIQGSLLVGAIGFLWMLTANSFATVLLTTSFFVIGNALLRPVTASLISKAAPVDEQGVAMGLHNSFMSLGRIVGPIWAGFAFDLNLSLPYETGAVVLFAGFLATFIGLKSRKTPVVADVTPVQPE